MILVTGAKGFIGKNLVERIKKNGHKVIEVDMEHCEKLVDYPHLNCWHLDEVTHIYHLGAITQTTETDVAMIYKYNIDFSIKLFNLAINYKIPISYASSASVYGHMFSEPYYWYDHSINPLNYYAMSKATIDLWVEDNIERFVNVKGYRFYNVYGEYEDHKGNQASPIHKFVKEVKETGVIKVFDETSARDFIWVGDVISAMMTDERPSGIYDLGTGYSTTFMEVAESVIDRFGGRIVLVPFPEHLKGKYQYDTYSKYILDDFKSIDQYLESLE